MGQGEMILFLVLMNLVVMIFIAGIILFIFQYRKRKITHNREKDEIARQHKLDLLNTQLLIRKQTMDFIGREIHDSVAQKLTLASIYIQRMEFEQPANRHDLVGVNKVLNDSLTELRQLSKDLMDEKLEHNDLQDLVLSECERINTLGICSATFDCNKRSTVNIAAKSSIFRIIQEFIQNSIKHAHCKNIRVSLKFSESGLDLFMSDDGCGFDMDRARYQGSGLNNIRRRIQLMNGKNEFFSEAGAGVKVHVFIPKEQLDD